MKKTTQQLIQIGNGAKRIREAVSLAWVIADLKPYSATNCRSMFSERNGMHTLLSPINHEKDN